MKPHPALSGYPRYSAEEFRRRAEAHISDNPGHFLDYGDYKINPGAEIGLDGLELKDAAVLIPVVENGDDALVIFTQRTSSLRKHSGQIAFPGGKLDADETPEFAALREAEEEIGLARGKVEILGRLDPYRTVTGFDVMPVVGAVTPPLALRPDPTEVADIFEVPLVFFLDAANHQRHTRTLTSGATRAYYAMPYGDRYIWGATAGMLLNLYEVLTA
jgi:8-oxo-dGTP pyrophosphatase MutT (NUDIX family)